MEDINKGSTDLSTQTYLLLYPGEGDTQDFGNVTYSHILTQGPTAASLHAVSLDS